jgi:hypothetical protein
MTGMIARLGRLRGPAAGRAVAVLVMLGLLASGVAVPHASAGLPGGTVALQVSDCPMTAGPGAGHHMGANAQGGHQPGAGDMAATGDGCAPAACCPADIDGNLAVTPRAHAPSTRAFGLDGPPPAAPGDRRDRPPRTS